MVIKTKWVVLASTSRLAGSVPVVLLFNFSIIWRIFWETIPKNTAFYTVKFILSMNWQTNILGTCSKASNIPCLTYDTQIFFKIYRPVLVSFL